MAEKNSAEKKMSKKDFILTLASCINGQAKWNDPGCSGQTKDLILYTLHGRYSKTTNGVLYSPFYNQQIEPYLCRRIKSSMGNFQIDTLKELKQLISQVCDKGTEYKKIQDKEKEHYCIISKLTRKFNAIGLREFGDECFNRLNYVSTTFAERWINRAKKENIDDNALNELKDLMDKACKLSADAKYFGIQEEFYSALLFDVTNGEPDARTNAYLKKFDLIDDAHPLPKDYPLIKSGIIADMDQLLDIISLFFNEKAYLYLDFNKFRDALVRNIVGKEKLIKIIENARDDQLEKLAKLESDILKLESECTWYYNSVLRFFLRANNNSDRIQRVLNVVLKHENLAAKVAADFMSKIFSVRKNSYDSNIQISVDSFERLLNARCKDKTFNLSDSLFALLELLKEGVKCCSKDMSQNVKKIDLREIFKKTQIRPGKYCIKKNILSEFINFVFANVNNIVLDSQLMNCIYPSFITLYNKNKGLGIVIDAILKKQSLECKDGTDMQQKFKEKCQTAGINVSCDQDDIFFVDEKLYLVDKNVGISQFNSVKDFFEYVCSNVNTQEGKRYFNLLMRLTNDESNIFFVGKKLYLVSKDVGISQFDSFDNFLEYVYSNVDTPEGKCYARCLERFINNNSQNSYLSPWMSKINDDCYTISNIYKGSISNYSVCLILKILESQSQNKPETKNQTLDIFKNSLSKWDSFLLEVCAFVIFPLVKLFQGQPPQPKIIKADKIEQSNEINGNKISIVPKQEIKTGPSQLQGQ